MDDKTSQRFPPPGLYRNDDEEIDLADIWRALAAGRAVIGAITSVCIAAAVAVAFLMAPVYRAETLLAPVESSDKSASPILQFGALEGFAGIGLGGGSGGDSAEALATLTSRVFTDAFIREEKLMPVLYADRWDAARKGWKEGEEPPTAWDAYRLFDRNVRFVNKDVKTGLVTLAIEWRDPDSAALWANRLVQRINAERRAEAIREAETSISYLKEQLAETSLVEMQQAIYQLIESKIRKIMVAKSLDEYAFRVIDPAVPPQEYSSPRRVPIIILGLVFGLIVSAVVVLVRARFAGASRG
ncbi:MAG: hypothetical protein IPK65_00210 [Gammaproteobacteria bacterium]|nr:hypothetical protein [Gammaproteobacteria bacterium]